MRNRTALTAAAVIAALAIPAAAMAAADDSTDTSSSTTSTEPPTTEPEYTTTTVVQSIEAPPRAGYSLDCTDVEPGGLPWRITTLDNSRNPDPGTFDVTVDGQAFTTRTVPPYTVAALRLPRTGTVVVASNGVKLLEWPIPSAEQACAGTPVPTTAAPAVPVSLPETR